MDVLFEILTPLGCKIHATKSYWQYLITKKHPYMKKKENVVKDILKEPQEIHKSSINPSVYLYYRKFDRLYCVIVKHHTEKEGFLITAYPADKVKEGELIWTR